MIPEKVIDRLPENLIFLGYRGSHSHGTFVPKTDGGIDDIDLMGVFIGPKEHYLGFGRKEVLESFPDEYDLVSYELRKFVSLLVKNNPNVLGMLWLEPDSVLYRNNMWDTLTQNRDLFVSKEAYHSFSGYAFAQLKKMTAFNEKEQERFKVIAEKLTATGIPIYDNNPKLPAGTLTKENMELIRQYSEVKSKYFSGYMGEKRRSNVIKYGYDTKNASHLIRLITMCIEFLDTGTFTVKRPDADYLIDIKQGKYPLTVIQTQAQELFSKAEAAFSRCTFPDRPDRDKVESLLVEMISRRIT